MMLIKYSNATSVIFANKLRTLLFGVAVSLCAFTLYSFSAPKTVHAYPTVDCYYFYSQISGGTYSQSGYDYTMGIFQLIAQPAGGWTGGNQWYGVEISSQQCNHNGIGSDGVPNTPEHSGSQTNDLVNPESYGTLGVASTTFGLRLSDGRWPVGLYVGNQKANDLWASPAAVGSDPVDRPPVFRYNWESPASTFDDSGAFIIGGSSNPGGPGGSLAGNHLVWCQALIDDGQGGFNPDNGTGYNSLANNSVNSCAKDIDQYPNPSNGSGFLMNNANCNLRNPAAESPSYITQYQSDINSGSASCNSTSQQWLKINDIGNSAIGHNTDGSLAPFYAHQASRNTLNGGWGATTYVQAVYPQVNFSITATCSSVSYTVTDPMYPTYSAADPSITFTLPDGSTQPESGLSGSFSLPSGEVGTLTGAVTLDGESFAPTKSLNCPPNLSCNSVSPTSWQAGEPFTVEAIFNAKYSGGSGTPNTAGSTITYTAYNASSTPIPVTNLSNITWNAQSSTIIGENTSPFTITTPGVYSTTATLQYPGASTVTCPSTLNIYVSPYLKIYGGDAIAGSEFNPSSATQCSANSNNSDIESWNLGGSKSYYGAGSQFAAYALGNINGFATSQRTGTGLGLAFSNNGANLSANEFGGSFTSVPCAYDYYDQYINDGIMSYTGSINPLYTTPIEVDPLGKIIILIKDADVFIDNNITTYKGSFTLNAAPQFKLVVEGGNIYISNSVTQLDGLYIAQPDTQNPSKGIIYDCATGVGSPVPHTDTNFSTDCDNQLIVNGALVANSVQFMRTFGNTGDTATKSDFQGADNCTLAGSCSGSNAAEVINYNPLVWITTPNSSSNKFDSIVSLPPVL